MILDNEFDKKILLHLIDTSSFQGNILEHVLRLKRAILTAGIAKPRKEDKIDKSNKEIPANKKALKK